MRKRKMVNILSFGDSNTYGLIPGGAGRYGKHVRWTGRLQDELGEGYHVIEEGLCGRTTVFEDEFRPGRRGADLVGIAMETHNPVDILIIMLGTNDCKTRYKASAGIIAKGAEKVIKRAKQYGTDDLQILLISPIHLGRGVGEEGFDPEFDEQSERVSRKLAAEYAKVAQREGCAFLDASGVAFPGEADREHLDQNGHRALAEAVEEKIREMEYQKRQWDTVSA